MENNISDGISDHYQYYGDIFNWISDIFLLDSRYESHSDFQYCTPIFHFVLLTSPPIRDAI